MENNFSLKTRDTSSKDRSCPGLNHAVLRKPITLRWWSPSKKQLLLFMSSNLFSLHGFSLHFSFVEQTPATTYISLPLPLCLPLLQSCTVLYSLLLFPCSICQDWFLLWNVLHMQMLELGRLGTEIKRVYFSPLLTTGEKSHPIWRIRRLLCHF